MHILVTDCVAIFVIGTALLGQEAIFLRGQLAAQGRLLAVAHELVTHLKNQVEVGNVLLYFIKLIIVLARVLEPYTLSEQFLAALPAKLL